MSLIESNDKVTVFACGPSTGKCKCQCPDGPCEHKWDGKEVQVGPGGWSITCSKCGMAAMDHDLWVMP